jgi:hypothetical protein
MYIDKEGNISGLADDFFDSLGVLGHREVQRVSNVEFDAATQSWVATDLLDNVIAAGPTRSRVIELERTYLNKKIEEEFAAN